MPDAKYQWSTDNSMVATVDNTGLVRGVDRGQARIHVRYENINEAKVGNPHLLIRPALYSPLCIINNEQAVVNVVDPSKMDFRFYSLPDKQEIILNVGSWYLIANTSYSLEIEVFDAHDRRLYAADVCLFC